MAVVSNDAGVGSNSESHAEMELLQIDSTGLDLGLDTCNRTAWYSDVFTNPEICIKPSKKKRQWQCDIFVAFFLGRLRYVHSILPSCSLLALRKVATNTVEKYRLQK